jgi:DNA-binding CsgD family transcriptional regulator
LERLIERLEEARDIEDLQREVVAVRDHYEVDHVVYHWVSSAGEHYGCGTYGDVWKVRYLEKDYIRIDPVILGGYNRFHPLDWAELDWSSKAAKAFRKDAIEHGIGNQGLSIPIRGPSGQFALFTVSTTFEDAQWAAFKESHRRDLILIAHFFNQKALEFEGVRLPDSARMLSPREVDVMTCLAMGLSRAQAAGKLDISESTLRVYLESARNKLGALNTTHAVARAMQQGLIVV